MNRKLFAWGASRQETAEMLVLTPDRERQASFLRHLRTKNLIDDIALARASAALACTTEGVETLLVELGLIEEGQMLRALADWLKISLIDKSQFPPCVPDGVTVGIDHFSRTGLLPIASDDQSITIATASPLDDDTARAIAFSEAKALNLKLAPAKDIQQQLAVLKSATPADLVAADIDNPSGLLDGDTQRLKDLASEAPVIRLLERLLVAAADFHASDIHIEPLDDCVQIKFRIDGVLHPVETLDKSFHLGLVSRVKVLARLNIAENRLPQDGQIRVPVRGRNIDFRVATSPMLHGEGAVLRLLDRRDIELDLHKLGFPEPVRRQLDDIVATPNGIFLVTGPTGSGKTTTLYSILAALNKPTVKIFTVEDPVEYHLRGINQIPVRPQIGLDFASILRSILRQDPDVIMIGEIRDGETARVAVQAALTGHLVLTTLHTNSAAASITRLRDLGIEDFLLASTLRGVIAQRLVRRLCEACKSGGGGEPAAPGCNVCGQSGYHGRIAVCEAMTMTERLRGLIAGNASEGEIVNAIIAGGMVPLREHANRLVQEDITSQDEVIRAIGIESG